MFRTIFFFNKSKISQRDISKRSDIKDDWEIYQVVVRRTSVSRKVSIIYNHLQNF